MEGNLQYTFSFRELVESLENSGVVVFYSTNNSIETRNLSVLWMFKLFSFKGF